MTGVLNGQTEAAAERGNMTVASNAGGVVSGGYWGQWGAKGGIMLTWSDSSPPLKRNTTLFVSSRGEFAITLSVSSMVATPTRSSAAPGDGKVESVWALIRTGSVMRGEGW